MHALLLSSITNVSERLVSFYKQFLLNQTLGQGHRLIIIRRLVICTAIYTADLHWLNDLKKIFAVTTNLLTSSGSCSPAQTDVEAQILMVRKEVFTLIICFESKVSHVANNVPKGTPCWKYRMRLSCLIQQLKALDEIISPSRLWHSLLVKRAQHEKRRMEGDRIRGEKGMIFCQKCTHLRTWHSLCL